MRNKSLFLLLVIVVMACTSKTEVTTEQNESTVNSKFILDSLLRYDSEQELIAAFGQENIARDTAWYPEGMGQYIATVLYPFTKNEVRFEWADSAGFAEMLTVTVNRDSSEWSSRGVKIGTRLNDLVTLNGKAFMFSGFGWDYGGAVMFNEGGRLTGLNLSLAQSNNAPEEADSLMGEITISSNSPIAKRNNPYVSEILLVKRERQYD